MDLIHMSAGSVQAETTFAMGGAYEHVHHSPDPRKVPIRPANFSLQRTSVDKYVKNLANLLHICNLTSQKDGTLSIPTA